MPQLPVNPNLQLTLPNGDGERFYLHEFTLEEGLSQITKGELLLYSAELIDAEELDGYLGCNATVKVTQRRQELQSHRWYSGIISQVEHLGILKETGEETAFGYRMVIEPSLVNLCHSCHNYSLQATTPEQAITAILTDYGIPYIFHLTEDTTQGLTETASFFQNGESDYEFLLKILSDYGISFNFISSAPSQEDTPSIPVLHLFAGQGYLPASPMEDNEKNTPLDFHCRTRNQETYPMTRWQMNACLGVDSVSIDYQTSGGEQLHQQTGDAASKRALLFNHSPFGTLSKYSIERITQNYLRALKLNQQTWRGETICIEATPGTTINVWEFYGRNNDEEIQALITSSRLFCRAPMPDSLLNSLQALQPTFNVTISCMDRQQEFKFTSQTVPLQLHPLKASPQHLPLQPALQTCTAAPLDFVQAIVCDKDGNTDAGTPSSLEQDASGDNHYCFTARLLTAADSHSLIRVWMTMPLAGTSMGLFKIPKKGEYILIARANANNDYYLIAYLPSGKMPFVSDIHATRTMNDDSKSTRTLLNATIFRVGGKTDAGSTITIGNREQAIAPYSYNGNQACQNGETTPTFSEVAFYGNVQTVNESNDSTQDMNQADINLQSTSTIQVSATNDVTINSPALTFTGPADIQETDRGELTVANFKNIGLSAEQSIIFKVGKTQMTITPATIVLQASRWSSNKGALCSSIILNALTGTVINGLNTCVSGAFSCSMADGAGASVSMAAGNLNIVGAPILQKTIKRTPFILASAFTGTKLAEELIAYSLAFAQKDQAVEVIDKVAGYINPVFTGVNASVGLITAMTEIYNGNGTYKEGNIFAKVCELLAAILQQVEMLLEVHKGAWLSKPTRKGGAVTNRDAFNLTVSGLLTTAWVAALCGTFKDSSTTMASEIKLTRNKTFMDARTGLRVSVRDEEHNAIVP